MTCRWVLPIAIPLLLAAGCDVGAAAPAEPSAAGDKPAGASNGPLPSVTLAAPRCPPPGSDPNGAEVAGSGPNTSLFAMFFRHSTREPLVGREIKIVFRMTGSGEVTMSANGPGGRIVHPTWGPEWHSGSNWERPGDEWGAGWSFPVAGCWVINAVRSGTGRAAVTLRVS